MLNIMLVDDEVLALDYLKNMVNWERYGYCVTCCAQSANKALELYEKDKPDVVISDIRMPAMDGLELTRRLKEKNKDIVIILLSAYGDFDYAKKAILYGVANYLLKHELCEELLVAELQRAAEHLKRQRERDRIYQEYFIKQLIYQPDTEDLEEEKLGNRLFLLLLHKRRPVVDGEFLEEKWHIKERDGLYGVLTEDLDEMLFYVADAQITDNNWMALYRIEHTVSVHTETGLIERKCAKICSSLQKLPDCAFDILYSGEITQHAISGTFRRMSRLIRHDFFYEANHARPLFNISPSERKILWGGQIRGLKDAVYEKNGDPAQMVKELFLRPGEDGRLDIIKSLMPLLNSLLREICAAEHITEGINGEKLYTMQEVMAYYMHSFAKVHEKLMQQETDGFSRVVQDMIHYIHKNYKQELSLDMLGGEFGMNGVYLGQIFKKEVGITFLKYLTNVRMEEAKRLLAEENCTVSKTAKQVGYFTSQYFAKVFARTVGMKPQEYRKWMEDEERKDG
ncbi:MAG: response regulator [Eubacterium sp.]|jgi:two-component system response regulator YesN|nr:response regulator [Eubacterium sp.]NBI86046.1 response regulator [Lachnospiraceae bacterium]